MNDLSRTLMSLFATGFNPRLFVACMLIDRLSGRRSNSIREDRQS